MLAVMSLADGVAAPDKTALVRAYADALDVHDGYLDILTEVAADEVAQASACMMRKNVASFPTTASRRPSPRCSPEPDQEARP